MERFRRRPGEAGFTLIELLSSMALLGILGSVLALAMSSTVRAEKVGDDEASGLGDVRTVVERWSGGSDVRCPPAAVDRLQLGLRDQPEQRDRHVAAAEVR